MDVVLVDAGGTNIGSVSHALERLGVNATMTADPARIRAASHVILPGVGAAAAGMRRLRSAGLEAVIRGLAQPVLGICLGMQLLFEHSSEGATDCLGVFPGGVSRLRGGAGVRVPHMGWNHLQLARDDCLLAGIADGDYAYFVHGYAAPASPCTLAACTHGECFSAIIRRGNFCGVQFHPERSGPLGARMLKNFLDS